MGLDGNKYAFEVSSDSNSATMNSEFDGDCFISAGARDLFLYNEEMKQTSLS